MEMTARERVLDYVVRTAPAGDINTPMSAGVIDPASEVLSPEPEIMTPEPMTPDINEPAAISIVPESEETAPVQQAEMPPVEVMIEPDTLGGTETLGNNDLADSVFTDFSEYDRAAAQKGPKSFGFFTTASDYLSQRGQNPQPRLTLRYDISRKNAKTAAMGPSSIVDIIIGTDYAAISKSPEELVIYDFKEKRLLNVNKFSNSFTNASLYAAAYRAADTVGKMTNGGKLRQLPLGEGVTLDAFYLESALGFADGPPLTALSVSQADDKITADFEGERVFSATLNGPKLEDYRQAYSFIGLLYHSEPVHPAILAELKDVRTAPNAMTFHSFGPTIPDGEIISWTLKSKMSETATFPLPSNAASVVEQKTVSPLAFVMSEAVSGRALGGRVEPSAALSVINQQMTQGSALSAWVSAQSLKDMLGGCEQLTGLCKAISEAERGKAENEELSNLIEALSKIENRALRAEGLSALKTMVSAPDAPSLVLRRAGLALSKMTPAERQTAGLTELDPAELLSQAIARNPYDGLAYQGLARLKAARGDFIQSWDINDAMRALLDANPDLGAPIIRAEAQLEARVPGFFPPVDP